MLFISVFRFELFDTSQVTHMGWLFKKCYSLCKKCSGNGNDSNNLCTECKDSDRELIGTNCICKPYYNYEKTACISSIPDYYYNDDTTARTIDKCPTECKTCTAESVSLDLCTSCNVGSDYYYKIDDSLNTDSYKKCYVRPRHPDNKK